MQPGKKDTTGGAEKHSRSKSNKLHKAVWEGDIKRVKKLLKSPRYGVNDRDLHGNAPLHIAAHFANKELVTLLLENGADCETVSLPGWRAIDEAISTGAHEVAYILLDASFKQYRDAMSNGVNNWNLKLKQIPDYTLDLSWEFSLRGAGSWIPFVGNFLPNDVCKITKKGSKLRLDYTLKGFQNFKIIRANLSFLYDSKSLYLLDHDHKTVQDFCQEPGPSYKNNLEENLRYSFAHDCCSHLPVGSDEVGGKPKIVFTPKTGWFSKSTATETVDGRSCKVYQTALQFRTLIRSDPHAKQTRIPRSLKSNDALMEYKNQFATYFELQKSNEHSNISSISNNSNNSNDNEDNSSSESLSSIASTVSNMVLHPHHHLHHHHRHHDEEEPYKNGLVWDSENITRKIKTFEGNTWISDDYPLSIDDILLSIELFSPANQVWKFFLNYIGSNLPPGFPVKIQVPMFYILSAEFEFKNIRIIGEDDDDDEDEDVDLDAYLTIPKDYKHVEEAFMFGQESREMFKFVEKSKSKSPNNSNLE